MNKFLQISAPAKINLFLHVVGQRADGYHLLQSVFQLIDLADVVTLMQRDDDQILRVNPLPNVPPQDDLVVKAAKLIQNYAGISAGVAIDLEKNIPMGAGLGGGSSDAASTLLGLNQLWDLKLPLDDLMQLGLQLGADVPFFIQGHNAFVEGIGEVITPVELPDNEYLVIFPGVNIPTKEIFSAPDLTRNHSRITIIDFAEHKLHLDMFLNDLQFIAEQKYGEVKSAVEWLKDLIPGSRPIMSGSGSSVFCKISNNLNINYCLSQLPQNWKCYKVKGLKRHSAYNLIPSGTVVRRIQQGSRQVG